jgi:oxalate decarboxylase/phosphoglucose isomerase-like protein (cupin superfamily)
MIRQTSGVPCNRQHRSYYAELSLSQWLALTPAYLVEDHLHLDQQVMAASRKQKSPVVPASVAGSRVRRR